MNSFATYYVDCNGEGLAGTSEDLEAAMNFASELNSAGHHCEVCGGPSAFVGDLGSEKKDKVHVSVGEYACYNVTKPRTNINYFDEDILELQNSDKEKAESIETNEDVKE
jgi:hypothetical protein